MEEMNWGWEKTIRYFCLHGVASFLKSRNEIQVGGVFVCGSGRDGELFHHSLASSMSSYHAPGTPAGSQAQRRTDCSPDIRELDTPASQTGYRE